MTFDRIDRAFRAKAIAPKVIELECESCGQIGGNIMACYPLWSIEPFHPIPLCQNCRCLLRPLTKTCAPVL